MTDRLSALLHDEVATLDVPPPPAAAILRRGRAVRRRGQAASTVATLAVVGVIAATAVVATRDGEDRGAQPVGRSGAEVLDTGATFSVGTTLWYDDATRTAPIPDAAVKSLYYTSAGVLVRHGDNNYSDGGGEQRFSLVLPSGEVRAVSVVTEEVAHTTDAARPYLAWTDAIDGVATLVVHDVAADEEVARVALPDVDPDAFLWTTLAGDTAYLLADGEPAAAVSWETGEVHPLDLAVSETGGSRALVDGSVVDLDSGETVYQARRSASLDLSPDGRYVLVQSGGWRRPSYDVVDLDAPGTPVHLDQPAYGYSWTAGNELMSVAVDAVATCDPESGACTDVPADLGVSDREFQETVRPGGTVYES